MTKKFKKIQKNSFLAKQHNTKHMSSIEIPAPTKQNYFAYTKSNCSYCVKVKDLLKDEEVNFINCDDFLVDAEIKDKFLSFIEVTVGKSYRTFPMVFYNNEFVGGFTETKVFHEKKNENKFSLTEDF